MGVVAGPKLAAFPSMVSPIRHVLVASLVSGALLAASTWLFGCSGPGLGDDRPCTLIGGVSGLELTLAPERAGTYDIVVRSDDGLEAYCPFTVTADVTVAWGACRVRAGTVVTDLYGPDGSAVLLHADRGVPAVVDVQIFATGQDGSSTRLLSHQLTPSYTESYPNGPECDPEPSRYAKETLIVPGGEESM